MKGYIALMTLAGVLSISPVRAHADIPGAGPVAGQAQQSAQLISRAQTGLEQYLRACAEGDGNGVERALTKDAVLEHAVEGPGIYRTIDATVLIDQCRVNSGNGVQQPVSNLWMYPTPDENTVFVHYDIGAGTASHERHLVLLEMRGERIAKIRDFSDR
jgi:ketosteroid isomerase-like protein